MHRYQKVVRPAQRYGRELHENARSIRLMLRSYPRYLALCDLAWSVMPHSGPTQRKAKGSSGSACFLCFQIEHFGNQERQLQRLRRV